MKPTIELEIRRDGSIEIKTVRNAGSNCRSMADALISDLGLTCEAGTMVSTPDAYVTPAQQENHIDIH